MSDKELNNLDVEVAADNEQGVEQQVKPVGFFAKVGNVFSNVGKTLWRWIKRAFMGGDKELSEKDKFNVDLVVLSIAVNMLAVELTVYIMRAVFHQSGTWSDASIVQLPSLDIPLLGSIPVIGRLLSGYNIIVYLSWIFTILLIILMKKTKYGRYIVAVGENKEAAVSVGISVTKVRYFALILSGVLSGLAGAFLSVGHLTLFTRDMSAGRGWLGNAAALFGFNNPGGSFAAGLFFGFADALALRLQNVTKIPSYIIQVMPYVCTIVILSIVSWKALRDRKKRIGGME